MLHKLQDFAQEGTFGAGATIEAAAAGGPGGTANAASTVSPDSGDLDLDQLDEALGRISRMFDPVEYGFGTPKFPNPARLSFLLRLAQFPEEVRDVIGEEEAERAVGMAIGTLRRIRDGGLRDHLGGGFMRFSVTNNWSMPHFEKMVGENALLLGVFLDAWLGYSRGDGKELSLDDEFADVVLEVADYLTSPLVRTANGGFVTSEAADSFYRRGDRHMREGAFYTWTRREFDQVVGGGSSDDHASTVAAAYWDVQEDGNVPQDQDPFDEFINQNILSVKADATELSKQLGVPAAEIKHLVSIAREKLRAHREKERVHPVRDEKVVVGTNGIIIAALARTASALRGLDADRAGKYLQAARDAATFIKEKLWAGAQSKTDNPLRRFFWERPSQVLAFADDYAFLLDGLLDLYTATLEREWLDWAKQLQGMHYPSELPREVLLIIIDTQTALFYDAPLSKSSATTTTTPSPRNAHSGGFYSTESATLSPTILRLKSGMDKAHPSTNAVSASNLFRLGTLLDTEAYVLQARETVNAFEAEILQYPWLFVSLLTGVVTARLGVKRVEVRKGDAEGLRRWYTTPRAEAGALVLIEEKEKAGDGKDTTTAAEGLVKKVEKLVIGERS
jgi:uncharacterized protein YyaL (SSP411 family)